MFLHLNQRDGVKLFVIQNFRGQIVAAVFSLLPNDRRYPPNSGMVEQHNFDNGLDQVDCIIGSANMSQFVSENRADFILGQIGHRRNREQHYGFQPADD